MMHFTHFQLMRVRSHHNHSHTDSCDNSMHASVECQDFQGISQEGRTSVLRGPNSEQIKLANCSL